MSDNNNLSAKLVFQVGQVEIPLGELLTLNEGAILGSQAVTSYYPQVRAVLNDRPVALGELVEIDGKIGFKVNKLL